MSIKYLERMTWKEVENLDKEKTLVFLPLSPIEQHGTHLPLGTDILAAVDMTNLALKILEEQRPELMYLLLPALPLGCTEGAMHFAGTISIRKETLKQLLVDVCTSMAKHGLRKIVITNHHLDLLHIKAIQEAVLTVTKKYDIKIIETASLAIYCEEENSDKCSVNKFSADCELSRDIHAGYKETSFIMYQYPELLKEHYSTLEPIYIEMAQAFKQGKIYIDEMGSPQGYIGSPAHASLEYGKFHLEEGANSIADLALKFYNNQDLPQIRKNIQYVLDTYLD